MEFTLSSLDLLARARADLRIGLPIVLKDGDSRALVLSAEAATADRLSTMRAQGSVALAITSWRAKTLKARAYDGDLARIMLSDTADLAWVHSMADPSDDFTNPMKGPFQCQRDGDASIARAALAIMKSARLLPAALVGLLGVL